jgi:hypothetical protein
MGAQLREVARRDEQMTFQGVPRCVGR